jgi:hypothetical protein
MATDGLSKPLAPVVFARLIDLLDLKVIAPTITACIAISTKAELALISN